MGLSFVGTGTGITADLETAAAQDVMIGMVGTRGALAMVIETVSASGTGRVEATCVVHGTEKESRLRRSSNALQLPRGSCERCNAWRAR